MNQQTRRPAPERRGTVSVPAADIPEPLGQRQLLCGALLVWHGILLGIVFATAANDEIQVALWALILCLVSSLATRAAFRSLDR